MPPGKPIRLVLVDDDDSFLRALQALLEAEGFEVAGTATNGRDGIDLVRALRPDVVTLDLDMPVLDGVQATRAICADADAPSVVIVSGSPTEHLDEAFAAGARWSVPKREVHESLVRTLRAAAASDA